MNGLISGTTPALARHLPAPAVAYGTHLWQELAFSLVISRPRRTKLGDFRALRHSAGTVYTITVNENLNPYAFLITYLHEVAHLLVHRQWFLKPRRRRILPHGPEWQQAFREVMEPVLNETVFPAPVLNPLRDYLQDPAAATGAHPALTQALRTYDAVPEGQCLLIDLPEGQNFRFLRKEYIRGMKRRTRIVCTEKGTGIRVSIWAHVWVEKL